MKKPNPWRGFCAYDDEDSRYPFCGRNVAIRELRELIDGSLCCTLYGKSGTGKSSLLHAGVSPLLRKNFYLPVPIRLQEAPSNDTFVKYIIDEIRNTVDKNGGTISPAGECSFVNESSLYSFFSSSTITVSDFIVFPAIFIDQIEETFMEAADYDRLNDLLKAIEFAINPGLNEFVSNFRFVLSIREDDLYLLEDRVDTLGVQQLKNCRYRLRPVNVEEAHEIIEVPARVDSQDAGNGNSLFECDMDWACEKILSHVKDVDRFRAGYDLLLLSLTCSQLYDYSAEQKHEVITKNDVENYLTTDAQGRFYRTMCQRMPRKVIEYIEGSLVSEQGRRKVIAYEEYWMNLSSFLPLKSDKNKSDSNDMPAILQSITIDGAQHVELVHDRIAGIIAQERQKRKHIQEKGRYVRRLKTAICTSFCLILAIIGLMGIAKHYARNSISQGRPSIKERISSTKYVKSDVSIDSILLLLNDGKYKNVIVSPFHPDCFSYHNSVYVIGDSTFTLFPNLGAESITQRLIVRVKSTMSKVYLIGEPDRYLSFYFPDGCADSTILYVPHNSRHVLLYNKSGINPEKFYDVREMSMLETWLRDFGLRIKLEQHGTGKTILGVTKKNFPGGRLITVAIMLSICVWFDNLSNKRKGKKKLPVLRTILVGTIEYGIVFSLLFIMMHEPNKILWHDDRPDWWLLMPPLGSFLCMFLAYELFSRNGIEAFVERWKYPEDYEARRAFSKVWKRNMWEYSRSQRTFRLDRKWYVLLLIPTVLFYCSAKFGSTIDGSLVICEFYSYIIIWLLMLYRCHDVSRSGWWLLVPGYFIYLFFAKGEKNTNQFGIPFSISNRKSWNTWGMFWFLIYILLLITLIITLTIIEFSDIFLPNLSYIFILLGFIVLFCELICTCAYLCRKVGKSGWHQFSRKFWKNYPFDDVIVEQSNQQLKDN